MISRRILAALALLCALTAPARAQTGSVKTPAQLNTEINTGFADNTTGGITPFKLRQYELDLVASVSSPSFQIFTQNGTGAVPITFDQIFRTTWVTPEMYATNNVTCTGADDGPAIQRAINYAGTIRSRVRLKPCRYTVVTPVVDPIGVELVGYDGEVSGTHPSGGTVFDFEPLSAGQIGYRVRNAGNIVLGGGISNVMFYSNDTTTLKTALEVEDVSRYRISKIKVRGAALGPVGNSQCWSGANSIGLRLRGREFIQLDDVDACADFPLILSDNPNSTIDSDWLDARKLYLIAIGGANIVMEDGVNATHMNFDGVACVVGTHCFKNLDTTSTGSSLGWTFRNFGIEQGGDASAYNFLISHNTPVYGVEISGFQVWDNLRNGAKFRNVVGLTMSSVFYQTASPGFFQCLDVDSSVRGLSWTGSYFLSCSATAFTGQTLVRGESLNGFVLPRTAEYASTLDDPANNVNYEIYASKVAPSSPAAGKLSVWFDSTCVLLQGKNSAGTVTTTVLPDAGASNNFVTGVSACGVITKAQPTLSNLAGWGAGALAAAGAAVNAAGGLAVLNGSGALALANGGTGSALTAANGGIFYSDGTGGQILPPTTFARRPLTSGASTLPSWGTYSIPSIVASGSIPCFDSTSSQASSALLPTFGVVYGGGIGGCPAATSPGTNGQVFVGVTSGAPLFVTMSGDGTITNAGVFAIGATKVTSAMLNADVFSTAHTWAGQQTLVAPALGTPASGNASNLIGTTAAVDTSNTSLATNAFVIGQAAAATPLGDGTAAVGTSTRYARADHVHPIPTQMGVMAVTVTGVDFSSAGDVAIPFTLPPGFTRMLPWRIDISGASANISAATFGVFSATGGGGVAIVAAGTSGSVTTASDATLGNALSANTGQSASFVAASLPTPNTIYFRKGATAAGTANVTIRYFPEL